VFSVEVYGYGLEQTYTTQKARRAKLST